MSCTEALFITMRRHISSVASLLPETSFIRFTAFTPMGVAALPRPRRLADKLAQRKPIVRSSLAAVGKSLRSMGRSRRVSFCISPDASISFASALHRQIAPAMENTSVIALCAPESAAAPTACALPVRIPVSVASSSRMSQITDIAIAEPPEKS